MNHIEWLRELNHVYEEAGEVADELDRLQRENEELRNRHKELREANLYLNERLREAIKELHPLKGRQEIAALKAKSTEPVANKAADAVFHDRPSYFQESTEPSDYKFRIFYRYKYEGDKEDNWGPWNYCDKPNDYLLSQIPVRDYELIPLYTTPPTATALVEDFKRRVLEAIRPSPTLKVSKALQPMKEAGDGVREVLADIIESLPLINDFNQGEK